MCTGERDRLLRAIANIISDYGFIEFGESTPAHVNRWVNQFDADCQLPILQEINHIFSNWYFSRQRITDFLSGLARTERLTGPDHEAYWRAAHFLDIQVRGGSQTAMLELFGSILREEFQIDTNQCGTVGGHYIYIDDFIFSGTRVVTDLRPWIERIAPPNAIINIIVLGYSTYGQYSVNNRLQEAIRTSGKTIRLNWWRCLEIENRARYSSNSEVLWPSHIPEDPGALAYFALSQNGRYPWQCRTAGRMNNNKVFSSEAARDTLEQQFLTAGLRIRGFCQNPQDILKPLGFQGFPSLGFGAMVATYRNCPNNCPLALWWGSPNAAPTHPFHHWYPLLPRQTYENQHPTDIEF